VLQGVQKPDTELTDDDKALFEKWTEWNYDRYWKVAADGKPRPIDADVVVIDDPQRKQFALQNVYHLPTS
jgi:alpha,alpha-trehalose phosphorylase (configuration-retaining)